MNYLFLFLFLTSIYSEQIGFLKLTKDPIYLKKNLSSKLTNEIDLVGASKKNEFLIITSKIKQKTKTYYEVFMKTRYMGMGKKEKNFTAFIESSFGKFYSNEEFTKESLKNLPESFPLELANQILEKEKKLLLNFSKSQVQALKTNDFYLVHLLDGYYNSEGFGTYQTFSYLLKKDKSGKFQIFEGKMSLFQDSVEDIDLDDDGIPEIHQIIRVRTSSDTPNFYGFVNGKMTAISLPGRIDPKTKRIKQLEPSFNPENVKDIYKEFIYKQGKFEEVK